MQGSIWYTNYFLQSINQCIFISIALLIHKNIAQSALHIKNYTPTPHPLPTRMYTQPHTHPPTPSHTHPLQHGICW